MHGYIDDVRVGDKIRYDGKKWEVVGLPMWHENCDDDSWQLIGLDNPLETCDVLEGESIEFLPQARCVSCLVDLEFVYCPLVPVPKYCCYICGERYYEMQSEILRNMQND